MPKLVRSFSLIAVHEPEGSETFTLKAVPDVPVLNADNVQQGEVVFYVEHKLGSDTDKTAAFFTVRYLNASLEVAVEQYPAQQKEASQLTDTDGSVLTDTDGAELYDTDGVIGGAASEKLEELHFTWPATKYGYASVLKVEAYEDEARTALIAEGEFTFTRELPVYKARGEEWSEKLTYHNGEFILLKDSVYMWNYPIPGNSAISPDLDLEQNKQGLILTDDKTHWILYTEWPLIATKQLFSQFALLGGAVMAGKMNTKTGAYDYAKMYSQTGRATNSSQDDTNYPSFNPALEPYDSTQTWNPKACIDWRTGKSWFSDTTISGTINADAGKIGPFVIDEMSLTATGPSVTSPTLALWYNCIIFTTYNKTIDARFGTSTQPAVLGATVPLYIHDKSDSMGYGAYIYIENSSLLPKTGVFINAEGTNSVALEIVNGTINVHGKDTFPDMGNIGYTGFFHVQHAWDAQANRFRNGQVFFKNGICVGFKYFD